MEEYGDWTGMPPYEEEQDVYTEVDPNQELAEMLGDDPTSDRVILYSRIQNMSSRERRIFVKIIQQDALMDLIHAMKNLKKTTSDEWKDVIKKLNKIKDIKVPDKSGFDFSAFLNTLIPLVGALAATLLASRDADKKDIECAKAPAEKDPLESDPTFGMDAEIKKRKSIVLQLCDKKENGFSD